MCTIISLSKKSSKYPIGAQSFGGACLGPTFLGRNDAIVAASRSGSGGCTGSHTELLSSLPRRWPAASCSLTRCLFAAAAGAVSPCASSSDSELELLNGSDKILWLDSSEPKSIPKSDPVVLSSSSILNASNNPDSRFWPREVFIFTHTLFVKFVYNPMHDCPHTIHMTGAYKSAYKSTRKSTLLIDSAEQQHNFLHTKWNEFSHWFLGVRYLYSDISNAHIVSQSQMTLHVGRPAQYRAAVN